ncbi:MAG: DUF1580 domain-containing protein [Pirellulales bacterium]|nr:DUF1580 domain-containing protein [Pirellulales bacterium]
MVALLAEKRYALSKLAQREHVHASTVWRWVNRGIRGVKLGTLQVGGRTYTTDSLYEQFVRETTAAARGDALPTLQGSELSAEHRASELELAADNAHGHQEPKPRQ